MPRDGRRRETSLKVVDREAAVARNRVGHLGGKKAEEGVFRSKGKNREQWIKETLKIFVPRGDNEIQEVGESYGENEGQRKMERRNRFGANTRHLKST